MMTARFRVGQVIRHRQLGYRGVVANVDPQFEDSPEWYEMLASGALGAAPPWYYILVDGAGYSTYVAESQLERDDTGQPIRHPHLARFFGEFERGRYRCNKLPN